LTLHSHTCPYIYDIYKKSFRQSATLKKHLCTHMVEQPFTCDVFKKTLKLCKV
jgi:hypothetical protein